MTSAKLGPGDAAPANKVSTKRSQASAAIDISEWDEFPRWTDTTSFIGSGLWWPIAVGHHFYFLGAQEKAPLGIARS